MLSYRHSFHAGNHADVLKHAVQSLIIDSLKLKDKPFVYHDTHAGAGRYNLSSAHAEKTGEYSDGIGRLWKKDHPALLASYLSTVQALNKDGKLAYYPGSPLVAHQLCRSIDRLTLSELHPTDFPLLQQEFGKDRKVKLFKEDGYARLKANVPPPERRGLVLIDPPYELKTEHSDMVNGVMEAVKRWSTGTYAIWYPVVYRKDIDFIEKKLKASGVRKILQIELSVLPDTQERGMTGSGMIVINPPWKLEQQMNDVLPWLRKQLAQSEKASSKVSWLVPE